MVRDRLWDKCAKRLNDGAMVQLWTTNNEQGFAVRTAGEPRRQLVDYEGLLLVRQPWEKRAAAPTAAEPDPADGATPTPAADSIDTVG